MITVKVSELLKMAKLLSDDGIEYVIINESEGDEAFPKSLHFTGDCGYNTGIDYESIDHVDLPSDYELEVNGCLEN